MKKRISPAVLIGLVLFVLATLTACGPSADRKLEAAKVAQAELSEALVRATTQARLVQDSLGPLRQQQALAEYTRNQAEARLEAWEWSTTKVWAPLSMNADLSGLVGPLSRNEFVQLAAIMNDTSNNSSGVFNGGYTVSGFYHYGGGYGLEASAHDRLAVWVKDHPQAVVQVLDANGQSTIKVVLKELGLSYKLPKLAQRVQRVAQDNKLMAAAAAYSNMHGHLRGAWAEDSAEYQALVPYSVFERKAALWLLRHPNWKPVIDRLVQL